MKIIYFEHSQLPYGKKNHINIKAVQNQKAVTANLSNKAVIAFWLCSAG